MINKIKTFDSSLLDGKFIKLLAFSLALIFSFDLGAKDAAEVPAVSGEVAYILNTFLFFPNLFESLLAEPFFGKTILEKAIC